MGERPHVEFPRCYLLWVALPWCKIIFVCGLPSVVSVYTIVYIGCTPPFRHFLIHDLVVYQKKSSRKVSRKEKKEML